MFPEFSKQKTELTEMMVQMKQKTEVCFLGQQTCPSMVTVTSGGHLTFEKMRCYISSIYLQKLFCLLTFTVVNVSLQ
jgi:hypothetical protein